MNISHLNTFELSMIWRSLPQENGQVRRVRSFEMLQWNWLLKIESEFRLLCLGNEPHAATNTSRDL